MLPVGSMAMGRDDRWWLLKDLEAVASASLSVYLSVLVAVCSYPPIQEPDRDLLRDLNADAGIQALPDMSELCTCPSSTGISR